MPKPAAIFPPNQSGATIGPLTAFFAASWSGGLWESPPQISRKGGEKMSVPTKFDQSLLEQTTKDLIWHYDHFLDTSDGKCSDDEYFRGMAQAALESITSSHAIVPKPKED